MKKIKLAKSVLSLFFVFCIVISLFTVTVSAASGAKIDAVVSKTAVKAGEQVKFNVYLEYTGEINALNLKITFNKNDFTYTEGSASILSKKFNDATVGTGKANELCFIWEGAESEKINTREYVFGFSLTAADKDTGGSDVKIELLELYRSAIVNRKFTDTDIPITQREARKTILFSDSMSGIKAVEDKINNIGTVKYNDATKNRIQIANNAYAALTVAEKRLVSNYQVLLDAIKQYELLKNQSFTDDEIEAAVKKFKADYAFVLNASSADVIEMPDRLEVIETAKKALEDFEELPIGAQSKLINQRTKLRKLISDVQAALSDEEKEQEKLEEIRRLKEEAKEIAERFKESYKYVLELTADSVTILDDELVEDAAKALQRSCIGNDYVIDYLKDEESLLNALRKRISEIKSELSPELEGPHKEVYEFRTTFAYILSLKPEELTYDDKLDVFLADAIYSTLSKEAQNMLTSERELLDKFLNLMPELEAAYQERIESGAEPEIIKEYIQGETIIKTIDASKANTATIIKNAGNDILLKLTNRKTGSFTYIIMILTGISVIWFAGMVVFYKEIILQKFKERKKI